MPPRLPYRLPDTSSSPQEALLALVLALVGASTVVTHAWAWRLAFHPQLGEPVFELGRLQPLAVVLAAALLFTLLGLLLRQPTAPSTLVVGTLLLPFAGALATGRLYAPFAWTAWRTELTRVAAHRPAAQPLLAQLDTSLAVALTAALAVALLRSLATGRRRGDVHGSARFATSREIAHLGLRRRATGIVVGGERRWGRQRYFHAPDRRHVGIFGPSGCGKTTKIIIPTLLTDPSSMVVLDVKMELFHLTAAWRRRGMGHTLHAFAPSVDAPWSAGYNPLLDIPRGPHEVAYAQALAQALVDPDGKIRTPDFWHASAQSLLTAAILHVLYAGADKSLAGVNALLASPDGDFKRVLEDLRRTEHDPGLTQGWLDPKTGNETATHPVVALEATQLADLAYETLTGILATARARLALFHDPLVAANTRRHDFTLADLGNPEKPTTIYLIIPARDIGRLSGLLRLFLQQLSFHLTGELAAEGDEGSRPDQRRRLTLVLDELAAVGRLDLIARQIAYLRGYGIQIVAAVQTASQLYDLYGQYESIRGNLGYLLVFPSTEQRTAEEISKLLGDRTVYAETRGRSTGTRLLAGRRSTQERDHRRPLLTPDEVRRLSDDQPVLLVTGEYPVLNRVVGYWGTPNWHCLKLPPPLPHQLSARS